MQPKFQSGHQVKPEKIQHFKKHVGTPQTV